MANRFHLYVVSAIIIFSGAECLAKVAGFSETTDHVDSCKGVGGWVDATINDRSFSIDTYETFATVEAKLEAGNSGSLKSDYEKNPQEVRKCLNDAFGYARAHESENKGLEDSASAERNIKNALRYLDESDLAADVGKRLSQLAPSHGSGSAAP